MWWSRRYQAPALALPLPRCPGHLAALRAATRFGSRLSCQHHQWEPAPHHKLRHLHRLLRRSARRRTQEGVQAGSYRQHWTDPTLVIWRQLRLIPGRRPDAQQRRSAAEHAPCGLATEGATHAYDARGTGERGARRYTARQASKQREIVVSDWRGLMLARWRVRAPWAKHTPLRGWWGRASHVGKCNGATIAAVTAASTPARHRVHPRPPYYHTPGWQRHMHVCDSPWEHRAQAHRAWWRTRCVAIAARSRPAHPRRWPPRHLPMPHQCCITK